MTHRFVLAPFAAALVVAATALAGGRDGQTAPAAGEGGPFPVSYWNSREVAAAFDRGAVLFDGRDGRNFMVHASHRDAAGMAEVHHRDTDIIYVLEGSATFVTGGAVESGRTTDADEVRGASIRGGETRQISKGDVLIVPSGTPHWFKAVSGPLNYYVVKVR